MTETHTIGPSYPPPPEFAANANATAELYGRAEADRLGFWAGQANRLSGTPPFTEVLDWSEAPFAKWFVYTSGTTAEPNGSCTPPVVS
jgi:acetyl-CoA synthetase